MRVQEEERNAVDATKAKEEVAERLAAAQVRPIAPRTIDLDISRSMGIYLDLDPRLSLRRGLSPRAR